MREKTQHESTDCIVQVNATGVMPVIFASSLLALPSAAARYAHLPALDAAAAALGPNGPAYLPVRDKCLPCWPDALGGIAVSRYVVS